MTEQFVTYEIALKLKELGFDEISRFGNQTSLYTKEGNHTFYANYGFMYSGLSDGYIYAPLWQQVIDWFREQYKLSLEYNVCSNGLYNVDIHSIINSKFGYSVTVEINQLDFYNAREQSILKAIEICQKK